MQSNESINLFQMNLTHCVNKFTLPIFIFLHQLVTSALTSRNKDAPKTIMKVVFNRASYSMKLYSCTSIINIIF